MVPPNSGTIRLRSSLAIIRCLVVTSTLAVVIAARGDATGNAETGASRNAIFNGDFLDGGAGWTIGGPRDVEVKADHKMVAHRADSELSVRYDELGSRGRGLTCNLRGSGQHRVVCVLTARTSGLSGGRRV